VTTLQRRTDALVLPLLVVGCLGYGARLLVAAYSTGSNDIVTWERFANQIATQGLVHQYVYDRGFNHPPLMGWLASGSLALSHVTGLRFAFLFKLPSIAAELCTGVLLAAMGAHARSWRSGALAFALYGWSPVSILVSAHHGNTDCICAMLVLAAVFCAQCRNAPFWAGAALAAAINVKLIPVLCFPALLLSGPPSRRALGQFVAGVALGVLPFVWLLIAVPAQFARNAIAYGSNQENWGIPFLLRSLAELPFLHFHPLWERAYSVFGRLAILLSVGFTALLFGPTRRLSTAQLCTVSLTLFLVLAPGFGIQYLVYVAPVLFAVSAWRGFRYASLAGLFAGAVYWAFWTGSTPWFSEFPGGFPAQTVPFGVIVWVWLCRFLIDSYAEALSRLAEPSNAAAFWRVLRHPLRDVRETLRARQL
jgi:Glycosyltransferase family 87